MEPTPPNRHGFILGLSCFYHDSAAVLLKNGAILAAAQEERFTRKRHDEGFPFQAVAYCLRSSGITIQDVGLVAFYDKPFVKFFDRILETYLSIAPRGLSSFKMALPVWMGSKLWMRSTLKRNLGYSGRILFPFHHESHAASAFLPSPFEEAAIVTVDGVGEWQTTTIGHGKGNDFEIVKEIRFPHSLGLLYSAITYYTGFKVNSGEYKVMGLAPYGEPRYVRTILDNLIDLKDDGSFHLNQEYFDYLGGLTMTNARFDALFGGPPRKPESQLTQKEMDLARSVQEVTEMAMLRIAGFAAKATGSRNLCLAGGVALNCVANGKILRERIVDRIWVQPAAGDAGGALGSALLAYHRFQGKGRTPVPEDAMQGALLGPDFSDAEIESFLQSVQGKFDRLEPGKLSAHVAKALAEEKVVGWFQGRMEFGPRSLGARSILGDPRSPRMQKEMNLRIKFRESFRPFAPAVLREKVSEYFEFEADSPYMLMVAPIRESHRRSMTQSEEKLWGIDKLNAVRSTVPAVTHVDYSARLQTVDAVRNPAFHGLLKAFEGLTGCPILINTSFNVRGEPIVCTPQDAYACFMRTGIDMLVMGKYVLEKSRQPVFEDKVDWKHQFALD